MLYDIIVVGAGPGGSTFARQIARSGKKVLVIDGQKEFNKKPCGGLLAPDAQKALATFDLSLPKSVLVDPQIFSVKTMDLQNKITRYYQRNYLNMDRYAFDKWLLSLVPKSMGVDVIEGICTKIIEEGDIFTVEILINKERSNFKCKTIVGADGANSIVRKTFFKSSIKHYVSIQQWFEKKIDSEPFYSCVFDSKTSESCSWIIYKDEHIIFGGCFSPKNARKNFYEQKKALESFLNIEFGEAVKTEGCITYSPRKMSDFITGKNNVFLIGESAGFISASSFEGISSAIISGKVLADGFLNCNNNEEVQGYYKKKTRKLRFNLYLKTIKRWFMYTPWVRNIIMKSGIESIEVVRGK